MPTHHPEHALDQWADRYPSVTMLDPISPGLLWACATVSDVAAPETALCWHHVSAASPPHPDRFGDLPPNARLEDHSTHDGLSCRECDRSVGDLVAELADSAHPEATAAAIADVTAHLGEHPSSTTRSTTT